VTKTKKRHPNLEKSLADLETIVEELESGELSLDRSLQMFEKGIQLSRECQAALKEAEQKVQVLVNDELKDLDADGLDQNG
ncbi:uncharacterized protein METZ01_LOCUS273908, partial [marine metagenome]